MTLGESKIEKEPILKMIRYCIQENAATFRMCCKINIYELSLSSIKGLKFCWNNEVQKLLLSIIDILIVCGCIFNICSVSVKDFSMLRSVSSAYD